jgi:hypothetical protein
MSVNLGLEWAERVELVGFVGFQQILTKSRSDTCLPHLLKGVLHEEDTLLVGISPPPS